MNSVFMEMAIIILGILFLAGGIIMLIFGISKKITGLIIGGAITTGLTVIIGLALIIIPLMFNVSNSVSKSVNHSVQNSIEDFVDDMEDYLDDYLDY